MGKKFIVVKLREVLKLILLTIVGVAILGTILYLFIPKGSREQALYEPGTYSSEIILYNNPALVEVTVSNDEILNIELLNMGEIQEVFYPLFQPTMEEIAKSVIESQVTDYEISSVDKSTTSEILLKAIDVALSKAKVS